MRLPYWTRFATAAILPNLSYPSPPVHKTLPFYHHALSNLCHEAIFDGLHAAREDVRLRALQPKPYEPNLAYGIISQTVPLLDRRLKELLRYAGIRVAVGGVFCHQSPKATFGSSTCEIGDLLIVCRAELPGFSRNSALLLQTKMHSPLSVKSDQFTLYSVWPKFSYRLADGVHGRDVQPKAPHTGAQFAVLGDQWMPTTQLAILGSRKLQGQLSLELAELMNFGTGKDFSAEPDTTGTGWNRVVWDLLRDTAKRLVKLRGQYPGKRPRGVNLAADGIPEMFAVGAEVPSVLALAVGSASHSSLHGAWEGLPFYPVERISEQDVPWKNDGLREHHSERDGAISLVEIKFSPDH